MITQSESRKGREEDLLRRIDDLLRSIELSPEVDTLLHNVMHRVFSQYHAIYCFLATPGEDEHFSISAHHQLAPAALRVIESIRLRDDHDLAQAFHSAKTLCEISKSGPSEDGEMSTIYLPLIRNGEVFAILVMGFAEEFSLTPLVEQFLSIISKIVSSALSSTLNSHGTSRVKSGENQESLLSLGLTNRQQKIAMMIAEGRTNRAIAREMGFSEATIRYETIKLYERLRVRNRSHAAARIRELQID